MQLLLDCLPCLMRQVLEASRLASADEEVQARIMDDALATASRHRAFNSAPALAAAMHRIVTRHADSADPYRAVKDSDIRAALSLEPLLEEFVTAGGDRLGRALKVSATGNVMDSALYSDLDIGACVAAELARPFARADLDDLRGDLDKAASVLILGDNAGEAVFDKVLARELSARHQVTFAVRAHPIINDVTAAEADAVGIGAHATVVSSGCGSPGVLLDGSSDEFLAVFERADVVISKGQGNFEALSEAPRRLYFLLKAKCPMIARALDVEVGDHVLVRHDPAAGLGDS